MRMELVSFNASKIRSYMQSSPALEQGIRYVMHVTSAADRTVAKETAIRMAEEKCYMIWKRRLEYDTLGANPEGTVFAEFEKDVAEKKFFYCNQMKDEDRAAEKIKKEEEEKKHKKWLESNERIRVFELQRFCKDNNLDFQKENKKYVLKKKILSTIGYIIASIGAIIFLAGVADMIVRAYVEPYPITALADMTVLWLVLGFAGVVVVGIGGAVIPEVPEGFYDQIDPGKQAYKNNCHYYEDEDSYEDETDCEDEE